MTRKNDRFFSHPFLCVGFEKQAIIVSLIMGLTSIFITYN